MYISNFTIIVVKIILNIVIIFIFRAWPIIITSNSKQMLRPMHKKSAVDTCNYYCIMAYHYDLRYKHTARSRPKTKIIQPKSHKIPKYNQSPSQHPRATTCTDTHCTEPCHLLFSAGSGRSSDKHCGGPRWKIIGGGKKADARAECARRAGERRPRGWGARERRRLSQRRDAGCSRTAGGLGTRRGAIMLDAGSFGGWTRRSAGARMDTESLDAWVFDCRLGTGAPVP